MIHDAGFVGQAAGFGGRLAWPAGALGRSSDGRPRPPITVYKSRTCGCCAKWVDHLRADGFATVVHDDEDMDTLKDEPRRAPGMRSCHTAQVESTWSRGTCRRRTSSRLLARTAQGRGWRCPACRPAHPEWRRRASRTSPSKCCCSSATGDGSLRAPLDASRADRGGRCAQIPGSRGSRCRRPSSVAGSVCCGAQIGTRYLSGDSMATRTEQQPKAKDTTKELLDGLSETCGESFRRSSCIGCTPAWSRAPGGRSFGPSSRTRFRRSSATPRSWRTRSPRWVARRRPSRAGEGGEGRQVDAGDRPRAPRSRPSIGTSGVAIRPRRQVSTVSPSGSTTSSRTRPITVTRSARSWPAGRSDGRDRR